MATESKSHPKDPFIYLGCPCCLRILRLDGLPLTDFFCNPCYEKIFETKKMGADEIIRVRGETERVSVERYAAIRKEITLERVASFSCFFKIKDENCGGPRIFFRGLSLCYKCHNDHYAPGIYILDYLKNGGQRYAVIGGLLPVGAIKARVLFQKNKEDLVEAIFLQKGAEALIFEQAYPLDERFTITWVWPTEFRRPDIFDKL